MIRSLSSSSCPLSECSTRYRSRVWHCLLPLNGELRMIWLSASSICNGLGESSLLFIAVGIIARGRIIRRAAPSTTCRDKSHKMSGLDRLGEVQHLSDPVQHLARRTLEPHGYLSV